MQKQKWNRNSLCIAAVSPVIVLMFFVLPSTSQAQSLWQYRSSKYESQVSTPRAKSTGDLLTVLIEESTNINNKDQRLLNKQNKSNADINGSFGFTGILGNATGGMTADEETESARSQNSNTQYKIQRGFTDRFQVVVNDVMPNGNLQILGTRQVMLDGDVRNLYLTGEVRPFDVSATNSVPSRQVFNLKLEYDTAGAESSFINQGWLGKKFNKIWPF